MKKNILSLIIPSVFLFTWFVVTRFGVVPPYMLPSPASLAKIFLDFFLNCSGDTYYSGTFWMNAMASIQRVALGFGIAAFFGVPLGIISGSSWWVKQILDTHIHALRAVPGIGWLPLAMVWFGIGTKTTVFLIALAAFFPIYLNSAEGALKINPLLKRAALMMGADKWALFRTVILPAALPSVANGLRIGLGLSWAYLVLGELTGVPDGLGALIMDARMMGHVEIIIVGMIAIAVLGRISDKLLILFLHIITGRRGLV